MLRLKCQFGNLSEIDLNPLFKHLYALLNKKIKKMLSPNLAICLHIDFISITKKVDLADILNPEGGVTQNDLKN